MISRSRLTTSDSMRRALLLCLLPLLWACEERESVPKGPPLFALKSAEETGINFTNEVASSPDFNILEYLYFYNGAGVASGDINNDGLIDLYFVSNQGPNKLYLNRGNWQFEDISGQAGVVGTGTWSTGVTMADVNGDGWLDIYVSQVGDYKAAKGSNQLFINNGDNSFTESAAEYGLDFVGFSTQAAFFDYDRDGDLDMYLLNHSIKNPAVFSDVKNRTDKDELGGDRLYESQLAQGSKSFKDVTDKAGIYSSSLGFGLGVAVSDVNNDGWPDLYISNDFTENDYLYINQQNGSFSEELEQQISHTSRYSMGNEVGDINNDGNTDIITTDMLPSDPAIWQKSVGEDKTEVYDIKLRFGYAHQYVRNTLQANLGNGSFRDVGTYAGLFATDWSWSPLLFDMDNDGWQDVHISNGIYKRPNDLDYVNYSQDQQDFQPKDEAELEAYQIENLPTVKIPNYSGRNTGGLHFEDIGKAWGLADDSYSNGSTYADLDNDGDLDLVLNNTNQEAFIYENKTNELSDSHYLTVALNGLGQNRFGVGSKVVAHVNGRQMTRELMPTRGFQSAVAPRLHFGLGEFEKVDSLEVYWPDGQVQTFAGIDGDQLLTVAYEPNTSESAPAQPESDWQMTVFEGFEHSENQDFKDFNREYLIPRKFSMEGPALAVADVNGDGLDDFYLGGAKGQAGALFIQLDAGDFELRPQPVFEQLSRAEDSDALFFDADGDGDQDLYVVSAGNEYEDGQVFTYDRLYFNDGQGNFRFAPAALPQFGTQGSSVKAGDIDQDGDLDLFVAANVVRGAYGVNPEHHLLINDGRGRFSDETLKRLPDWASLGMINDMEWVDIEGDGDLDMVMAGEWTAITLMENDGKGAFERASDNWSKNTEGWWFSITLADIDQDGDQDIIAGNLGLNSKLKASPEKPVSLFVNDFDRNGQVDPVMFHYMEEANIPFASRDDLIKQMAVVKKKHPDYEAYARVSAPEDIFASDLLEQGLQKKAVTFASMLFLNEGNGQFRAQELPQSAQFSTLMDAVVDDLNGDGSPDLLAVGNFYGFRNDIGRADAKGMTLLSGDGNGVLLATDDAFFNSSSTWGDYRKIRALNMKDGKTHFIAVRNNANPLLIAPKQP